MRFLCLHGLGTSNRVFQMQTAAFRYEIADQHTYEFVQGVVPWDLPPELSNLSDPSEQHYAYYDIASPFSFVTALDHLEAYILEEGPFDGVIAYSHGAGLAAMLLVREKYLKPSAPPLFKVAIFFSPVSVYDPVAYQERQEVRVLDDVGGGPPAIDIPTVVVYGEGDPRMEECKGVKAICNSKYLWEYVHDGGHEVPGIGVKNAIPETVKVARRGITTACMSED
ncbi:uncharacterized protein BDR25DRAFT_289247 [Lindgomyces ingoldianus]|uniref:Uncharacterized protein n=1 Tax=Lindgomyces ingoldianus TaxID=673940 RepID=A0ACB6QQ99_9PLEO|nr:uncharacterized protein BDR25DRAFT_289247 [Lindgomyces ingoldianus]KAF2469065.1 hypothetical protein BDR25DRAFT_289247 [Lindgomyces ingoldianus]